ncbi:ninja-family protein AFP3-like [Solanum pennellii]|uniref:Ninja-family protein n=1 Tax=Solanum pennellii TaxID=28526 RepID=A0ABM1G3P7_SOLPN|nr:ninja-family protein AFP3-like [Solanum pennellii]
MEKAKEKIGTSRNVENKNMKLNLGLPLNGESQGCVASRVAEVEIQQSPTQEENIAKEKFENFVLNNMANVYTKGEGPKGKKIEGLLYSCTEIDEVKIVCLCHGNFLNADEFVKHAGGGDVVNPLEHIFIEGKQIK